MVKGVGIIYIYTLQETNISHLWKRKIIFKEPFWVDMLVPRRVYIVFNCTPLECFNFSTFQHQIHPLKMPLRPRDQEKTPRCCIPCEANGNQNQEETINSKPEIFTGKLPALSKLPMRMFFFLDFDFPCLKKFCFLPCRIVRTNLRFRNKILTYTVLIVTQTPMEHQTSVAYGSFIVL